MSQRSEFLSEVLITATEGGIGYWSVLERRVWTSAARETLKRIEIYDTDERTGDRVGNLLPIGYLELERAIELVVDPDFEVADYIRDMIILGSGKNDAGEIDAVAADVLVQAAAFGEIVYS